MVSGYTWDKSNVTTDDCTADLDSLWWSAQYRWERVIRHDWGVGFDYMWV